MKRVFGVATAAALASAATNGLTTDILASVNEAPVPQTTSPSSVATTAHLPHQKGFTFEYVSSDQDDIEVDVSISSSDSSSDDEPDISASVIFSYAETTSTVSSPTSYIVSALNTSLATSPALLANTNLEQGVQKAYLNGNYGYYGGYVPGGYQGNPNPYDYNPYGAISYSPQAYRTPGTPTTSGSDTLQPVSTLYPTSTPSQFSLSVPQPPITTSGSPDYYRGYSDGWLSAQRSGGYLNGFNNGESEGYSSGFTVGFRAAQTGTQQDSFKEAYLEGETHGYYDGYFDGEQRKSYEFGPTYIPALGPTVVETSSWPFTTTSAPRAEFSLSYESQTASVSRAYSSYEDVLPSGTSVSPSPLATSSRVPVPVFPPAAPGYGSPYGGYGYGYGYPPPPVPQINSQGQTNSEPAVLEKLDNDGTEEEVRLNKRGIISDMFQGNRAKRRPVPAVNYAPPPLQVAQSAPVYQYQPVQACQQTYQVQAVQPRINDAYSGGGAYYAPQYAPTSYGYGYGYDGYQGDSIVNEANGLFSGAMQCLTSLLNPQTYCPGIFGESEPEYQQPQPYYYYYQQQQPYYQPASQPVYQSTYQQQPQLLTSYVVPQTQCYYVVPYCGDNTEVPYTETGEPAPAEQPNSSSPSLSAPSSQSPLPDNSGINSGDTTKLLNDQLLAQVVEQARQRQVIAQAESELSSAQALLSEQYQRLSSPVEQYQQPTELAQQLYVPYEQYRQYQAPAEQDRTASTPAQIVQPLSNAQPKQSNVLPVKADTESDSKKVRKPQLSVGGGERLNVFPPYATKSSN